MRPLPHRFAGIFAVTGTMATQHFSYSPDHGSGKTSSERAIRAVVTWRFNPGFFTTKDTKVVREFRTRLSFGKLRLQGMAAIPFNRPSKTLFKIHLGPITETPFRL